MENMIINSEYESESKEIKVKPKLVKTKVFKALEETGKIHDIEMKLINNNIELKSEIQNGIIKDKYFISLSFTEMKKKNIFAIQENIEEIFDQLDIYVNDEQTYLLKDDNKLIITIFTKVKKYPDITFELKIQNLDKDEAIKILIEKITNLESENEVLKSKFTILESENKNLKQEIDSIKEYIKEQKESIKFGDSIIVKQEETKMICDWINPNKKIKTELLYRSSRDGEEPEVFHMLCDYKGPLIFFIKVKNGHRFGAYSGLLWTSENIWIEDKDAFIFSLDNKLKFINKSSNSTIFHNHDSGPSFGVQSAGSQLTINFSNNSYLESWICDDGSCYNFKNKDLIGDDKEGKHFIIVEDYEVYLIIHIFSFYNSKKISLKSF